MFEEQDRETELADVAAACEWRAKKFDAGFGWITGPPRVRRARPAERVPARRTTSLEGQYQVPNQSMFTIGLGMVAPTILAHGSDAAKDAYLANDVPRRHRRLPAVLRARRRQRPRQPADQGRARRRRVGRSPGRRCGRRAPSTATSARSSPAPTPTCPSTRGSPASSSTCGRPGVEVRPLRQMTGGAELQRGVLQRGAGPRRPPPRRRQQRLERRADDADERAGRDRCRRRRRRPSCWLAADRDGQGASALARRSRRPPAARRPA